MRFQKGATLFADMLREHIRALRLEHICLRGIIVDILVIKAEAYVANRIAAVTALIKHTTRSDWSQRIQWVPPCRGNSSLCGKMNTWLTGSSGKFIFFLHRSPYLSFAAGFTGTRAFASARLRCPTRTPQHDHVHSTDGIQLLSLVEHPALGIHKAQLLVDFAKAERNVCEEEGLVWIQRTKILP